MPHTLHAELLQLTVDPNLHLQCVDEPAGAGSGTDVVVAVVVVVVVVLFCLN